jgi:hypothetical protein
MREMLKHVHKLDEFSFILANGNVVEQTQTIEYIPPVTANEGTNESLMTTKIKKHSLPYFKRKVVHF